MINVRSQTNWGTSVCCIYLINDRSNVHKQRVAMDTRTRHTSDELGNKRLRYQEKQPVLKSDVTTNGIYACKTYLLLTDSKNSARSESIVVSDDDCNS